VPEGMKHMEKIEALEITAKKLLNKEIEAARKIVQIEYPFHPLTASKRSYTDKQKMEQFIKDGFIDRYSGQKLVNPGILKVVSYYLPKDFPYHPHWKMEVCHNAYWEFVPTVDHIYPVALGGADSEENWATTSMLHNSIKSNWTLEQLQWKLYDAGSYQHWDGMTGLFVALVKENNELLKDSYIKRWFTISQEKA
jgi:5-methylcytosine-specific restriction endonuclease McrA